LPRSGAFGLAKLLERARRPTWRIWAENSPFDFKDLLKARGYRWNGEGEAAPRSWYVDVDDEAKEEELRYLQSEIYQEPRELLVRSITAMDRFSIRC
jgi:DNA polymerase-3 subunit epsilon